MLADITPIKQSQQLVEHLAFHDALTELPNRLLLHDRLLQALSLAERHPAQLLAVCYLDLDGFKPVNDLHGHAAGDHVLKQVARRIEQCVRTHDTVARLGGDEFVILLTQLEHVDECRGILERVLVAVQHAITLPDAQQAQITATIGVALYPRDGSQANALLNHADQALYQGKQRGRNRICMYEPDAAAAAPRT